MNDLFDLILHRTARQNNRNKPYFICPDDNVLLLVAQESWPILALSEQMAASSFFHL
jgi:hypothetical protein